MKIKELIQFLPQSEKLSLFHSQLGQIYSRFSQVLSIVTDSAPFQFLVRHKSHIELILYILWLIGCGYWGYRLIVIDAKPQTTWGINISDSRDAMVYLFFGLIGSVFVLFFVYFILKLFYNLFHEGIQSLFPIPWYSIVKPVSYLVILYFIFPFTGNIKAAGLTAYNEVVKLVHTSKQHDIVIEKEIPVDIEEKLSDLLNAFEKDKQE
jgi:hypothetical protein